MANDDLSDRVGDLESESFQLKLRNYYLERRLNASLREREINDDQLSRLPVEKHQPVKRLEGPHKRVVEKETEYVKRREAERAKRVEAKRLEAEYDRREIERARAIERAHRVDDAEYSSRLEEDNRSLKEELEMVSAENVRLSAENRALREEMERHKATAEDLVAFEAEQIADLQEENHRLKELLTTEDISTRTTETLKKDIENSFDFLLQDEDQKVRDLLVKGKAVVDEKRLDSRLAAECLEVALKLVSHNTLTDA